MIDKLPITILAQLDDVTVFQTAACQNIDSEEVTLQDGAFEATVSKATVFGEKASESTIKAQNSQLMLQTGQANFGDLNLGLHVNDDAAKVLTNRMRVLSAINKRLALKQNLPIKSLHWVNQVHGRQVYEVDNCTLRLRPVDADAIISRQSQLGLAIMTADCIPIVLYQPTTGQIAAIHAGWQGLAYGVIQATVERFTAPGKIMAWIGVSISQDHYEVGSEVRDKLLTGCIDHKSLSAVHIDSFDALFSVSADSAIIFNPEHAETTLIDDSKIKLNLPKLAAYQLQHVGIEVANKVYPCSYSDAHYYSYRRQTHLQQPATGRMALIIARSPPMNK